MEQQAKLQKEEDDLDAARRALDERDAADAAAKDALSKEGDREDGSGDGTMDRTGKGTGDGTGNWSGGITEGEEGDEGGMNKNVFRDDDDANKKDADDKKRRRLRTDTVTGKIIASSETRIILDVDTFLETSLKFKQVLPVVLLHLISNPQFQCERQFD